jgi:release factor glutamine methyltransferase
VPPSELEDLPPEVRADPPFALAGGVDVYERLGSQSLRWLRGGGVLAVEIDARRGAEVVEILDRGFVDARIEPDLSGRDRVVVARAP